MDSTQLKKKLIPAVGYCRFSSNMQREESIDAQMRAIGIYAEHSGYEIIKFYCDRAKSGKKTTHRDEFLQLHEDSANGTFQAVIVHKLDRYSRDVGDTLNYEKILDKNNVQLVSVTENLDNTPQGELIKVVIAACNRYQVANLATEIKKGHIENVYNGLTTGGNGPLGIDIVDKKFVINEHDARAVRMIFEMYDNGCGYSEIIDKLNKLGYRTKANKKFGKNSLYGILQNERYIGRLSYGKTYGSDKSGARNMHRLRSKDDKNYICIENAIPAIVDKKLFDRVQERMAMNKRISGSYTSKYFYLCSGLVYCMECGQSMSGSSRRPAKDRPLYHSYRCTRKNNNRDCTCREIRQELLEDFVLDQLKNYLCNESLLLPLTEQVNSILKQSAEQGNAEPKQILQSIKSLKKQKNNIVDAIAAKGLNDLLCDKLNSIESEIKLLQEKLNNTSITDTTLISVTPAMVQQQLRTELERTDSEHLKYVVRQYVERIEVGNEEVKVIFKIVLPSEDELHKLNITRAIDRGALTA